MVMSEKPTYEELEQRVWELGRAEGALKANESKYRLLVENANEAILVAQDGYFVFTNDKGVALFEFSRDELLSLPLTDFIHEDDRELVKERHEKRLKGEVLPDIYSFKIVCKTGKVKWVQLKVALFSWEDRPATLCFFTDITQRKRTDEALMFERKQLLSIFDSIDEIIYIADPNTYEILYVNRALRNAFQKDMVGGICYQEFQGMEAPCDFCTNKIILNDNGNPYQWEYFNPILRQDFLITDRIIKWPDGRDVRFELALNITDRKQAEEALKKSENKLSRIIEHSNEVFYLHDREHKLSYVSPSSKEIFGYTPEEMMGNWTELTSIHSVNKVGFEFTKKAIKTGDRQDPYPLEIRRKDGTYRMVEVNESPIKDAEGRVIGITGAIRDITEQKNAEEEKRKLQAQLHQSQKMESIGNLAGGIAHDFNNILSAIIGFTELALDDVEKNSYLEDCLQEIYTGGKRAKDHVKQILAFARQSNDEQKPIQIITIVNEVLNLIRSTMPTNIEIKENIKSDSFIKGNSTQVYQVLMNLCTNATHAMETTGGVLELELRDVMIDKKDCIEIKVSDTGVGIAPEIIGSVFEPYFTTKGPGAGTGLGLAMAQGVIENYGGKITVDSQLGKGTIFSIYLPITKKGSTHGAYVPEPLPSGKGRILFVDDELPIVKMGSQILERLGYSVTTRTSSVEALELFRAKPNDFEMVITDMTMPNLNGDELAVELIRIRPDIPILLCTGYSKRITDETALNIGIKAFVYKPVVKADLAKTVRKVLDEARIS